MKEFGPNEINSGMCQMGKITTITIQTIMDPIWSGGPVTMEIITVGVRLRN